MKLTDTITLADFRDEMQHRVIKHSLRSKPVREAVCFARRHSDPAFYRVALDKIDAQKQFHHEQHGLSRLDRIMDALLHGSARDIALTMLFVVVALVVTQYGNSYRNPESELAESIDVDRLAKRMGFYINEHQSSLPPHHLDQIDKQVSDKIDQGISNAKLDQALAGKLSSVMDQAKFDEMAVSKVGERLAAMDLEKIVAEKLGKVLDEPTLKQLVANRVDQHISTAGIKERVLAEFNAALSETRLNERISTHVETRLKDFDKQLLERAARFQEQIAASLRVILEDANIEGRLSQRIERTLSDFDKQLAGRVALAGGQGNAVNTPSGNQ